MGKDFQAEIDAIKKVHDLLEPLNIDARKRVVDYVLGTLGIKHVAQDSKKSEVTAKYSENGSNSNETKPNDDRGSSKDTLIDIRSLKEQKDPKSACEMAVLVAYYLGEHAPESERKELIGTDELKKYFKQAGYPLPTAPRVTLSQAKASGYFESEGHGEYKLNAVGFNLAEHRMPTKGSSSVKKKKATKKKVAKKKTTTKKKVKKK